jgi:hypothetical protein
MEKFYHINYPNWSIGDEISFGTEDNNYWKSMSKNSETFELEGQSHEAFKVLNAALEHYKRINHAPRVMKSYHFSPLSSLEESLQCLRNSINTIRELIFESVRQEHFPTLPSRQRSIWLIPDNKESIEFWNGILNKDNSKFIYELEVKDGSIHRASHKWLNGGTFSLDHWTMKAENYWKEVDAGGIDDEVLFEGLLEVKSILKV